MKPLILGLLAVAVTAGAAPIRVMLLDGQSGGAYHDWRATTPVLKKQLESTGLFQVDVATAPASGGDFSQFKPDFKKYQVVVSNLDSPEWPAELMQSFEQYMKEGGGLVVVHAADNAFPNWTAYNEMIGIGGWRGRTEKAGPLWYMKEGKLVSDPTAGSAGSHGARLPYKVSAQQPDHPILKGLPKVWMHVGDELYATLRGPGRNMTVIATAHSESSNKGTDRDEPILMTLSYGKGRIFHTVMGHDVTALRCAGFATTFQRGAEWAATGKVTQKAPADFPTADKVSTRTE
jgi:type 1 glutamine amidotransferase